MAGIFIVIDGIDGSGKGTQTKLIVERLRKEGYPVEVADFPQYGQWSAQFVERYLRGEFGTAQEVGSKRASLFFAVDRYAASFQIRKWLAENQIVISNRYVSANKGHQLANLEKAEDMQEFLNWINETEYNIFKIPIPNLTLFLHMPPEIGQQLVDKKEARDYIGGKKRDLLEADLSHLKKAEQAYFFCLDHDPVEKWVKIACHENNAPKSIETIHQEIYNLIKQKI